MKTSNFPRCLVTALVSLADVEQDEFREIAIEGLRLLSISNTELVAWAGGFRVLV